MMTPDVEALMHHMAALEDRTSSPDQFSGRWADLLASLGSIRDDADTLVGFIDACLAHPTWRGQILKKILPFVPSPRWPSLIARALAAYADAPEPAGRWSYRHECAEAVLDAALHQFPQFCLHVPAAFRPFWLSDDPTMSDQVGNYPQRSYFLAFAEEEAGPRDPLRHPTYAAIPPEVPLMRFGGMSAALCGWCHQPLHHLLTLDPIPDDVGVTGLARLQLVGCLSCIGWSVPERYYQHQPDGAVADALPHPVASVPEFPVGQWQENRVALVEIPGTRWRQLSWHNENMWRIGGPPFWVQGPEYRHCLTCGQQMSQIVQLGEGVPYISDDGRIGSWDWGAGGLGYVAWCDGCKVSAVFWSCT